MIEQHLSDGRWLQISEHKTADGGVASVYTDVIQGFIMVIAALLVLVAATTAVPDGFAGMSLTIGADDPEAISPWGSVASGWGMCAAPCPSRWWGTR